MLDAAGQGNGQAAPSTRASSGMQFLVSTLSKSRKDQSDWHSASAVQALLELYTFPATPALLAVLCLLDDSMTQWMLQWM